MNLLALAEQIGSLDLSPVHIEAERCLRALDQHSTCDRCSSDCPTQALSVGKSVTLKAEACVGCGQCLHDCPVGALTGADRVAEVWALALRSGNARTLEIACSAHPSPELGPAGTDVVLRVGTCLAALSPAAYVGLLSLGPERIVVRLDKCGICTLGTVKAAVERTLATVQQILAARHEADRVAAVTADRSQDWASRPVYTKRSELSRRGFFRRIALGYQPSPDSVLQAFDAPLRPAAKQPPRERRRLVNALHGLPSADPLTPGPLANRSFARMNADTQCSACGACARICPTGALNLTTSGDRRYQLTFAAADCINCGLCLKVCAPGALHRDDPTLVDLLAPEPVALQAGTLRECTNCHTWFASLGDSAFCPICDFRRQHPLGGQLPPGLLKQIAAAKMAETKSK